MTITKDIVGQALTLDVESRVDTITAPTLEKALNKSLPGITELTRDFEKPERISSAGLRVLLATQGTMNTQGTMVFKGASEAVYDMFGIKFFSENFTIQ